ncbi:uncharacterized protein LOC133297080 [Gastrolobium bilobum]|uniref:uncharacterized protein LOC133297080 n=1 Tax=Gastrolobium bilobum TaxID=150636 RepID=UPI002AB0BDEC|nr:uncharacterized protein LOC133297080 [Gastrolobium bilobum]
MASTSLATPNTSISTPAEKPEKFNGFDFKRWQQKMLFYMTTLSLAHFLKEDAPKLEKGEQLDKVKVAAIEAWKHSDFLYRNYILNGLDNTLYNACNALKTSKELLDSLDNKYRTKDAGLKKFIVGWCVIEKLLPSWKDFKSSLKHKRKEMTLEDLIMRLGIEVDNKVVERKFGNNLMVSKANVVEEGSRSKKRKYSEEETAKQRKDKGKKFKGNCYNCCNLGHRARDYKKDQKKPQKSKKKKTTQAKMVDIADKVEDLNLAAVVVECNLVGDTKEWWVDTGATRHVCSNN